MLPVRRFTLGLTASISGMALLGHHCLGEAAAQALPLPAGQLETAETPESLRGGRLRGTRPRNPRERLSAEILSGAGTTGFVSTNRPRAPRRANRITRPADGGLNAMARSNAPLRPGAGPPVNAPLSVTPPLGALSTPGAPGSPPVSPGLSAGVPPSTTFIRRRRPVVEEDPFAPIGVRVGSWILRPSIEVMGGYDTNPARFPGGRSSGVLVVRPDIEWRSDWRRHEGFAILRGTYTAYNRTPELDRPNLEIRGGGRIDVHNDARVDLEGRYLLSTENPGSPDLPAGLAKLPKVTTIGGTTTLAHRFNRLELALKGSVDRVTYEDSVLTDGTIINNDNRNYNQYATALRATYDLSPGMRPFAEIGGDHRKHDSDFDAFGFRRDSDGIIPRLGTTFEFANNLTGEASVGYLTRKYEDERLEDLRGLIVDASLIWRVSALTTVLLTARSRADETTVPGVSGILRRDAGIQVNHAFRRWLIGTAKLGYGLDTYEGDIREDNRYAASVALTYKATRSIHVKGELRQEWLRSNVPGVDYTATIALAGLRFQR